MTTIVARKALLPDGWRVEVLVTIEDDRIAGVMAGYHHDEPQHVVEYLIPGMPNVHSHAFQRGMAGRAERRGATEDTFWTWREVMYQFALSMSPEQQMATAAQAYMEMLESGFTRVGEFHYLHHDPRGVPYADIGEMAASISAAASESGIGLTLLPVFYGHADFGGLPPAARQRRFICDLDQFARLLDRCKEISARIPGGVVGIAPHSLRASTPEEIDALLAMHPSGPVHIHAAEQQREVDACIEWSGQRPVEYLLDRFDIDNRWCLIHATHLAENEVGRLARTGAVAGLCPVTEANLGDGIFPVKRFLEAGGTIGIGTDSNVLIGVPDELRQLEYSQRLRDQGRNVLAAASGSTGRNLFDETRTGGAQALGSGPARIETGARADLVGLNGRSFPATNGDEALDGWIFAGKVPVSEVWSGGRHVVHEGRHVHRDAIEERFLGALKALLDG